MADIIKVEHLSYVYNPGMPNAVTALDDVSFTVEEGDFVGIIGATGSGKSTILSLICRNYEFQKGEILIDGIDIRKIKISSLRRHFGQMLQDVFLFSGTIRSNIVLREDNISDEEIMQVCRYVNADHFIDKLEHGLDEEVRELQQLLRRSAPAAQLCPHDHPQAQRDDSGRSNRQH